MNDEHTLLTALYNRHTSSSPETPCLTAGLVTSQRHTSPSRNQPMSQTSAQISSQPQPRQSAALVNDVTGRSGSPGMIMASRYLSGFVDRRKDENPTLESDSLDLTPTNDDFGTLRSADSAFSEMITEEHDGSKMSKPHMSTSDSFSFEEFRNFETEASPPRTYAEGLKFVDSNDSQYNSSERSISKAQIVYRPIDITHTGDVTMIPGSGFFDASQSQADVDIGFLTAVPEPKEIKVDTSTSKTSKSKEKSRENRKSPSRFQLFKRNSKTKVIDEEPELEAEVGDGDDTPKVKSKFLRAERESASPKLSVRSVSESTPPPSNSYDTSSSKQRSTSAVHSSRDSSPSVSSKKPPLPLSITPKKMKKKKGSYSFRELEKPKSPDFKSSMPNLTSPPPSSTRESTLSPESFASSGSDDRSSKKPSLRKRISQSLRDLVGSKEISSSTSKSSWKFSEEVKPDPEPNSVLLLGYRPLDETMATLPSSVSVDQIPVLPTFDSRGIQESKLESQFKEISVDWKASVPANRGSVSSDEYHTASESEQELTQTGGLAMASIQILNSPTGLSQDFGYAPKKKRVIVSPAISESKSLNKPSKSTSKLKQGEIVSRKGDRKVSTPVFSRNISSPKSSQRSAIKTTVSGKTESPQSSPRSSLRTTSTKKLSADIGKSSPANSPRSSLRMSSQLVKKTTPTSSPRSSLRSKTSAPSSVKTPSPSQRTSLSSTKPISTKPATSPQPTRRITSPAAASPKSVRKSTSNSSPLSSPKSIKRAVPGKAVSPLTSPRSSQRVSTSSVSGTVVKSSLSTGRTSTGKTSSPSSSPRSSQRLGKVGATTSSSAPSLKPNVTPVLRESSTPKTNVKKNSSPSVESPLLKKKQSSQIKPSAPKLSKTPMEPVKESSIDSNSFSRNNRGRKPLKGRTGELIDDRSKRIVKSKKTSEHLPLKLDLASNTNGATNQLPPLNLAETDPALLSPDLSTPTTPGGTKKRKVGHIVAPIIEELVANKTATPQSTEQMNELVAKSAADISLDVDSLLAAVGEKLDMFNGPSEQTESKTASSSHSISQKNGKPPPDSQPPIASMKATVFEATPLHSRESSIDIDTFLEQAAEQEALKLEKEKANKKVSTTDKTPVISKKKTSVQSTGRAKSSLQSKSESQIVGGTFTSSLPPRPPLNKQQSDSSTKLSTADRKTSKTGTNRPRQIIVATTNTLPSASGSQVQTSLHKPNSVKGNATQLSVGGNKTMPILKPQSKSTSSISRASTNSGSNVLSRSSMRASSKKISLTTPPLHGVKSSVPKSKDSTLSRIGDRNMKSRASVSSRTGSSTVRTSVVSSLSQDSNTTRKISTVNSSSRRSMRRVSSGDGLQKKVKPGSSATLSRSSTSGVYSSMRKSGKFNTIRPRSSSNAGLSQSPNTLKRTPSGGRKVSAPSSTMSRKSVSASAIGSQSRKGTLKRTGSGGEILSVFDQISSEAQGSM